MRIAVTGHMDVSPDSVDLIRAAIEETLQPVAVSGSYVGISCLARGADSIFAEAVLGGGGELEVVLPSHYYREKKVKSDHIQTFDRLLSQASKVYALPFDEVSKDAYEAANEELVSRCDRLLAVWDGRSGTKSGTASVVEYARARKVPVDVVWPPGAARGIS